MANKFIRSTNDSETQSARGITFVHHKGGTGKTTSCLSIAGWLVKMDKKVLVVDLDPQGNATAGLGVDRKTVDSSIYDVLFDKKKIQEIILATDSGIHLAPSSLDLLAAETHMAGQVKNVGILKERLKDVEEYFDYILIDVPPGSTFLMMMGIIAFENIIIPLDAGVFAYETLHTLKTLAIDLNQELNIEINLMMMLIREYSNSMFDKCITCEVKKMLKNFLIENNMQSVKIFTVPFSRKIYRAQMKGIPVSHYAPYSIVGMKYKRIAKEVLNYVE